MQNYRVTFGGEGINYYKNFADCRGYYPIIKAVRDILKANGVDRSWWFFEPYVEITWLCDQPDIALKAMEQVCLALDLLKIEYKKFTPEDGIFADWHGLTPEEREFGAGRYAELANTSAFYYDNMDVIEKGMGVTKHYARTTHVIANQLALNFEEEGIALMKRGFLCLMMYHLGNEKAIQTYEKIFKEKYLGRDEDLS